MQTSIRRLFENVAEEKGIDIDAPVDAPEQGSDTAAAVLKTLELVVAQISELIGLKPSTTATESYKRKFGESVKRATSVVKERRQRV